MRNQRLFPGMILLGFGSYFFLQQIQIPTLQPFYTWPTLLIIVGAAFLIQGYGAKDYEAILPGVILAGFGLHFHIVNRLDIWPDHIGSFILIIALGFLLRYLKTGAGLFQGFLFLILAILLLFYDSILGWLGILQSSVSSVWRFWPLLMIAAGLFFLIKRK